jgi:putative membrane protein
MIYKSILAALIVTALGAGPGVYAAEKGKEKGKSDAPAAQSAGAEKGSAKAGFSDQEFVNKAAVAGLAEVAHGKLAEKKGGSDQVKQFGKQMVADHTKANDELKALAKSKNWNLPKDLDAKHKAEQDKLNGLDGAAFDQEYSTHMVAAHKEAVSLFEHGSKNAQDAELKAWAAKTLPVLRGHLQHAQGLAGNEGGKKK